MVREGLGEEFVVDTEILLCNPAFGYTCRTTGLEDIGWPITVCPRHPPTYGTTAEPFILEMWELRQIVETSDLPPWIPASLINPIEPEGTTSRRVKMPIDDLAHPEVESCSRPNHLSLGDLILITHEPAILH